MATLGCRGDPRATADLRGAVHVFATVLIAAAVLLALSGCRGAAAPAQEDTPEDAFARIQKAGADGDIEAYYDLCDENGQAGLCEITFQMITMEIYDRSPNRAKDEAGIQRAFQEELDLSTEQVEESQSDPEVRKKVFLQILEKSRGLWPDTLKDGLADLAKHEVLSCEIEREGVARLRLKSPKDEETWYYMVREGDRWLVAGDMSPYRPE